MTLSFEIQGSAIVKNAPSQATSHPLRIPASPIFTEVFMRRGEEIKEEKPGAFGKLKDRIKSTDAAKNFKESEEYEKLKEARADFRETVEKFKEGIENTQNPTIQRAV